MPEDDKLELFDPVPGGLELQRYGNGRPLRGDEGEEEPDLRAYWHIVQKRRWTIISVLIIVLTAAVLITVKEKPVYRAQSLVEIEQENPNILTVQQLFQLENVSDNYLETQYKVLRSDSLARSVIQQLHLDHVREFNPTNSWGFFGDTSREPGTAQAFSTDPLHEQAVLSRFEDHLDVEPMRRSRLVQIDFDSEDPKLAASALNAFTANYIQENLQIRWDAAQKASEWLSQQLGNLKIKLEKSEDNLQSYAQANGLLFLETEKGNTENIVDERLRQLQDELTQAQADRYQKESLYRLVQAGSYSSLPGVVDNRLLQDLTVQLAELESQKARLTPTFNPAYPKLEEVQNQINKIKQLLTQERKRAAAQITDEYLAASRRESLVQQAFAQQQQQANLVAGKAVQYNILKREVDTNKQIYESLLQRLKEAGVSGGLKASNIRVVDSAVPPAKPYRPNILLNLSVALFLGLSGGIGLAFLQERLDNTVKTSDDVERFLRVPALAMIPGQDILKLQHSARHVRLLPGGSHSGNGDGAKPSVANNGSGGEWLRIDHKQNSTQDWALAEAFRNLRTSVLFSTADRQPRSLTILSAEPGEGKTTICANLAISLSQLGKRVLLIDGDMRRPSLHKLFGLEDSMGLAGYLTAQASWHDVVHATELTGLDCIPCGVVPPNPSELLSSERLGTLVRESISDYHFVLVDSPPLLSVADGRILAALMDGALLVIRSAKTTRDAAQRAQSQLGDVGARVIGVVLNDVQLEPDGYHYNYYQQARENKSGTAEKISTS
ncbi:MAG: GumC family protein [Candidatus Acidiferrales bacterium]